MTEWILTLIGMAFLGVVIETILPNGKLNTFIKSVFALFLLFVIVKPLPKLFNKNLKLNTDYSYVEDSIFLNTLNQKKLENYEIYILNQLENEGITNVSILFDADTTKSDLIIQKVYVDICNVVLKNKDKHINITDTILKIVTNTLNILDKEVVIYGS